MDALIQAGFGASQYADKCVREPSNEHPAAQAHKKEALLCHDAIGISPPVGVKRAAVTNVSRLPALLLGPNLAFERAKTAARTDENGRPEHQTW